jgi:hypothetical protein
MPFTVQDLIRDRPPPVIAEPAEPVTVALERMMLHDYTQLPVVDGDRRPVGMITSSSILRALTHLGTSLQILRVGDAMDHRPLRKYRAATGDDLSELLERLHDTPAVLIVDVKGLLTGIVNSYDTTEFFQRKAEDMMLVEDIELALKELIRSAHASPSGEPDETTLAGLISEMAGARQEKRKSAIRLVQRYLSESGVASVKFDKALFESVFDQVYTPPVSRSLDSLTFNDLIQLLLFEDKWNFFQEAFGLDRGVIRYLLEGVRDTRNALAHFRGGLSPSARDRLRFCADRITQVQQRLMPKPSPNPPMPQPLVATGVGAIHEELIPEVEDSNQGGSRYAPLSVYLRKQPKGQERVELSFAQVEEIIQGALPAAALQHRSWWDNDAQRHVQARDWLDAGWRVAAVNFSEERVSFARARDRERRYINFYSELLGALREKADFSLRDAPSMGQSWTWIAGVPDEGGQVAHLSFSFAQRSRFRVELYIDSGDAVYNKRVFDALLERRSSIEAAFGEELKWERLDERQASRIAAYHSGSITDDAATLQELRVWALEMMLRFQKALQQPLREVTQQLAS